MSTARNLIFSILNIVASALSTLLLLPIIQMSLGVEAYGYAAVSLSFVNIATIVSVAITSMSARFISIALNKGEAIQANHYFNSIVMACLVLSVLMLAVFFLIALHVGSLMKISADFETQVGVLVIIVASSFCCTIIKTPFLATLYYSNDLYIDYIFISLSQIARVITPLMLFPVMGALLWIPYAGGLAVDLCALCFYLLSYQRFAPMLRVNPRLFEAAKLAEVIKSGVWVSITKAGAVLLTTLSLYLSNIMLGVFLSGIYASIAQLQSFLSVFCTAVVSVFVPQLYKSYAVDVQHLGVALKSSYWLGGVLMGSCCGAITSFAVPFMCLWAGQYMSEFMMAIVILIGAQVLICPLEFMNQLFITMNAVKFPALATIAFGVFNLALIYAFCAIWNMSVIGLVLAQVIAILMRNLVVYIPYSTKLLGTQIRDWAAALVAPVIIAAVAAAVGVGLAVVIEPSAWPPLILDGVVSVFIGSAFGAAIMPAAYRRSVFGKLKVCSDSMRGGGSA